jgi:iron complex outermembrane recepter protein
MKLKSIAIATLAVYGIANIAYAQQDPQKIERVEITGSSVKRIDAETALPVQVITKQEIARTGASSTEQLLASISSLSSLGGTQNSTGAGTSTYGLSSISLRGLGEERTLILVNGRRLAAFAGGGGATVNVNVIPLAAIERIEVLKDGASGVYGSDAVAGVVNFILAKSFEGVEVSGSYGTPTESGGGQNAKASITGGFGKPESGFSAVFSASFEKERALFGRDREYAKNGTVLPFFVSGATGQGNIEGAVVPGQPAPGDIINPFGTNPGAGYGNPLAATGNCSSIQMSQSPNLTTLGAPYCIFDSAPFVGLIPDRELANLTGNVTFKLTENMELFGDVLYSRSKTNQTIQPSPVRRSFNTSSRFTNEGIDRSLIIYPNNPVYSSLVVPYLTEQGFTSLIGQPLAVTARVFDFGPRGNEDISTQSRIVAGLKGVVANQDYEVALSTNKSKLDGKVTSGYFSLADYARIINDPNSNWNPWAPGGVQTGALADQLKVAEYKGPTLTAVSKNDALDGKLSGEITQLPAGPLLYAAGLQTRRESYATTPSPALESGDISGLGGDVPPVNRKRDINSAFGEINIPIVKGLEGTVALRNDRYNDIGASTNYKASARWQINPMILLRGSTGTGFRAPTLTDLWTPQSTGTSEQFDDPATGQTDLQVAAITGGNPNLRPEESKQASLGIVVSPVANFTMGVDFFQVKVKDILSQPSVQEIVSGFRAGDPAYAGLVELNGNNIELVRVVFANTGDAKVNGADVFMNWRNNFGFGRVDLGLNGTYMTKFDQTSPGGVLSRKVGTLVDAEGNPVIGAESGGVVLRWKHSLSATFTSGSWATSLIQNYSSGYEAGFRADGERNFMPSQSIYDANITYSGVKSLTLGLGVKNLFDKQPAIFTPVSNQFQSGYDSTQYDPRGRFVYLTASYLFR